jgi:hypothetical protein
MNFVLYIGEAARWIAASMAQAVEAAASCVAAGSPASMEDSMFARPTGEGAEEAPSGALDSHCRCRRLCGAGVGCWHSAKQGSAIAGS